MASCTTAYWGSDTTPRVRLTVTQSSSDNDSVVLYWKFEYIAPYEVRTASSHPCKAVVNGTTVYDGTYAINEKTGTHTIKDGSMTVNKTTSEKTVSFSCSMDFSGIVWSGTYNGKNETASGSITISAKTSYTITYNANGGSGAPSAQTKWYGTALTLSSTKPTRTGYTFSKWNTKSDGSGTSYSSGGSYTSNSAATLYAVWTENTLTVNYYSNYATEAFADALNAVGSNKNVIVRTVTYLYDNEYTNGHWDYSYSDASTYLGRTGYTGTGYWGTSTSGGTLVSQSTSYTSGQALAEAVGKSLKTGNASVNLYPQWEINTYTIAYNANGGSGNINAQDIDWQETFALSNNTFKREGYKFIGWNAYRNSDSKWYVNGQGWIAEDEITANGYEKKIYENQDELILDMSWIKGSEEARLFTLYAIWKISGVVYIDDGTKFKPYLVYVDNGTEWKLHIAYMDNGTEWITVS